MEVDGEDVLFKSISNNDESNLKSASANNLANSNQKTFSKTNPDKNFANEKTSANSNQKTSNKNFQKTFTDADTDTGIGVYTDIDVDTDTDTDIDDSSIDDTISDISLDELRDVLESDTDTDTTPDTSKGTSKGLLQQQQYGRIMKDNEEVEIVKLPKMKELYVEDGEGIVPVKVAMGKRHLKVENSLLYSLMIFGSMSEKECEEYKKICHSMNDHISYMIYQKALTGNKFYVKLLADLTKELLKRERTTLVQVQTERRSDDVNSILEQIENGSI